MSHNRRIAGYVAARQSIRKDTFYCLRLRYMPFPLLRVVRQGMLWTRPVV